MALEPEILPEQTDAKSPIDQDLMDGIRLNLERVSDEVTLAKGPDVSFRVNGNLSVLNLGSTPETGVEIDGAFVAQESIVQNATVYLAKQGAGGTLEINVKRLKYLSRSISGIKNIFTANTESVARGSGALPTQSITKAESDLATLSVSYSKGTISIDSIIQVNGSQLFRINLEDPLDALDEDYIVGKYINVTGTDSAANVGFFEIKEINKDTGKNIIVENVAGVAQTNVNGSIQLLLVSYTFVSIVPDNFAAGENFVANGHIDGSNDGTLEIYKKNIGGNNIQVFIQTALVNQVGAGGQCEILRYQYNFLTAVLGAFEVGEIAEFTSHSSVVNDGSFEIKQVNNNFGDNIVVYNPTGTLQPVVSGDVNTNRFVYALDVDPAGFFVEGDIAIFTGHDNVLNDGSFSVVDVKYLATNNIVVYNPNGINQLTPNGITDHAEKAITFFEDFSEDFQIDKSSVNISNTFNAINDGDFIVKDINRAAVSPFNIVCELTSGILQENPDGQITSETRSIFTEGSLIMDVVQDKQFKTVSILEGEIINEAVASDTIILLDILQAPLESINLAVNLK